MSFENHATIRYFVSYTGVKMPAKLVGPIDPETLVTRNTWIRAYYDAEDRLMGFETIVYNEPELTHRYEYYPNGAIKFVELINVDREVTHLSYDEAGVMTRL